MSDVEIQQGHLVERKSAQPRERPTLRAAIPYFSLLNTESLYNDLRRANTEQAKKERVVCRR